MVTAITLDHVTKTYGPIKALDDFSLGIAVGIVFGLLGPNGAGKSTAMRICSTLLRPDSGRVAFQGVDGVSVRRSMALMPQGNALDPFLNVEDNLHYYCRLLKLPKRERQGAVEQAVERFGLGEFRKRNVFAISGGQFRRAQLARTFLGNPRYLLLDEPTLGIDIQGKMTIWQSIREYVAERGCTVFLASNDMTEMESTCDRVAFIDQGKLIYQGDVRSVSGDSRICLECTLTRPFVSEQCAAQHTVAVEGYNSRNVSLRFSAYDDNVTAYLGALAREFGIESMTERRPSLTDLFTRFGRTQS